MSRLRRALALTSWCLVPTSWCLAPPARAPAGRARPGLCAVPHPPASDAALASLDACRTRGAAHRVLVQALGDDEGGGRLYGSETVPPGLSARPLSDAELALQTRTINSKYTILELIEQNGDRDVDRATLAVLCVFLFGSSSAILVQQAEGLPEIARWLAVFLLCFSPLGLVGAGLAVPEELSAALVAIQRQALPSFRKRTIQHEAGHFLAGYLLGWPVKAYQANRGMKNAVEFYPLGDADAGPDRARALGFDARRDDDDEEKYLPALLRPPPTDAPYFSKEGRGRADAERSVFRDPEAADLELALDPADDPTAVWPFRGFDADTVDRLAIVSVAGVCAEILAFGNAEGGVADLQQLRRVYGAAAGGRPRDDDEDGPRAPGAFGNDDAAARRRRREGGGTGSSAGMDEREMDTRTRFAIGYAVGLLRRHLGALDALAEVMARDGSVAECVAALEACPDVRGASATSDAERQRRERFRAGERGLGAWVEGTFLGGGKSIDAEDDGAVEGRGGGAREERFRLTGDDPFYAAAACAVAFFAWASNGGLTLH